MRVRVCVRARVCALTCCQLLWPDSSSLSGVGGCRASARTPCGHLTRLLSWRAEELLLLHIERTEGRWRRGEKVQL